MLFHFPNICHLIERSQADLLNTVESQKALAAEYWQLKWAKDTNKGSRKDKIEKLILLLETSFFESHTDYGKAMVEAA